MNLLKTEGLSKTYAGSKHAALKDFSLRVEKGEIVALLGESGCGKTTALRVMAGFERADSGTLHLQHRIIIGPGVFTAPAARGMGIVFQDYALFPHKTVAQNIAYGLQKLPTREREQRLNEMLNLVELSAYAQRFPHQLSGGQQQRVALARAMAPQPEVLLLDEPFSNIDTLKKNHLREELHALLKKTGTTAIFVTHDTRDVMAIADRVAVMRKGEILQTGTPRELYEKPRIPYLARFFGNSNIIPAKWEADQLKTPLGTLPAQTINTGKARNVLLSIRPTAFKPGSSATATNIRVKLKQQRFMGEHQEAEFLPLDAHENELPLLVHLTEDRLLQNGISQLHLRPEAIHIMDIPENS
ncbi:ABC transporter ATP-binding protein [Geofilum rhodophaeum]|uniref:ABC transporter ATP-binding protein n=1 Tax=Geofilum rhodophaeum TaxID=1965019 RepID=UPI000B528562|nr:ABC transporter ATP-binding protein [Geofilum rhodophaeum]